MTLDGLKMSLLTNAEIKTYLDITGTSDDSFINELIAQNTDLIEAFLNYRVAQSERTVYFFGTDYKIFGSHYRFIDPNVTAITSLSYKDTITDVGFTAIDSSNYAINQRGNNYYLYNSDGFSDVRFYELIYTAGYTSIPETIKKVLTEMVVVSYLDSHVSGAEKTLTLQNKVISFSGAGATQNFKDLYPRWMKQLRPYKTVL